MAGNWGNTFRRLLGLKPPPAPQQRPPGPGPGNGRPPNGRSGYGQPPRGAPPNGGSYDPRSRQQPPPRPPQGHAPQNRAPQNGPAPNRPPHHNSPQNQPPPNRPAQPPNGGQQPPNRQAQPAGGGNQPGNRQAPPQQQYRQDPTPQPNHDPRQYRPPDPPAQYPPSGYAAPPAADQQRQPPFQEPSPAAADQQSTGPEQTRQPDPEPEQPPGQNAPPDAAAPAPAAQEYDVPDPDEDVPDPDEDVDDEDDEDDDEAWMYGEDGLSAFDDLAAGLDGDLLPPGLERETPPPAGENGPLDIPSPGRPYDERQDSQEVRAQHDRQVADMWMQAYMSEGARSQGGMNPAFAVAGTAAAAPPAYGYTPPNNQRDQAWVDQQVLDAQNDDSSILWMDQAMRNPAPLYRQWKMFNSVFNNHTIDTWAKVLGVTFVGGRSADCRADVHGGRGRLHPG